MCWKEEQFGMVKFTLATNEWLCWTGVGFMPCGAGSLNRAGLGVLALVAGVLEVFPGIGVLAKDRVDDVLVGADVKGMAGLTLESRLM